MEEVSRKQQELIFTNLDKKKKKINVITMHTKDTRGKSHK